MRSRYRRRRYRENEVKWRPLLVMEASRIAAGDTEKMQNELKTSTTGTVMTVHVQEGATVETGATLITGVAPEALFACNARSS